MTSFAAQTWDWDQIGPIDPVKLHEIMAGAVIMDVSVKEPLFTRRHPSRIEVHVDSMLIKNGQDEYVLELDGRIDDAYIWDVRKKPPEPYDFDAVYRVIAKVAMARGWPVLSKQEMVNEIKKSLAKEEGR